MTRVTVLPRDTRLVLKQRSDEKIATSGTFLGYLVDGSDNKLTDGSSNYLYVTTECLSPILNMLYRDTQLVVKER
jgi:hypothetical protein